MQIPRHASLLAATLIATEVAAELQGFPSEKDFYYPPSKPEETESHKELRKERRKERQQRKASVRRNRR